MEYQETSREAWEDFQSISGIVDRKILSVLKEFNGATDEQIEEFTGIKHQTISANRRHLVERGLVRDSNRTTKTRSGRRAIVWELSNGQDR